MRFDVLGPLRVLEGERDLTPGPAKHRTLLAALLLRPGRPLTVDRLSPRCGARSRPHRPRRCFGYT